MSTESLELTKSAEPGKTNSIVWMCNVIFLLLGFLIAQFWLGMTINLEVDIPVKHLGAILRLVNRNGNECCQCTDSFCNRFIFPGREHQNPIEIIMKNQQIV